ncbi:hypothetical protein B0H10DRAFT_1998942 [Mycena sp. CBHHK59/15]|nr:hypothetical protein B0H10DRAFT_1998942 [Mycena sp. CBHHK59/15]
MSPSGTFCNVPLSRLWISALKPLSCLLPGVSASQSVASGALSLPLRDSSLSVLCISSYVYARSSLMTWFSAVTVVLLSTNSSACIICPFFGHYNTRNATK